MLDQLEASGIPPGLVFTEMLRDGFQNNPDFCKVVPREQVTREFLEAEAEKACASWQAAVQTVHHRVKGSHPLHFAAGQGRIDDVISLLKEGVAVDCADADGMQPIHAAAQIGHSSVLRVLLEAKACVHARTKDKGTQPIHEGVAHVEIVRTLLEFRADTGARTDGGSHPLHAAARNGHFETVELLLDQHADVASQSDADGMQPIHKAALSSHIPTMKVLLGARADIISQAHDGGRPLHFAAMVGDQRMGLFLLLAGADANACDSRNARASDVARAHNHMCFAMLVSDFQDGDRYLRNGVAEQSSGSHAVALEYFAGVTSLCNRWNIGPLRAMVAEYASRSEMELGLFDECIKSCQVALSCEHVKLKDEDYLVVKQRFLSALEAKRAGAPQNQGYPLQEDNSIVGTSGQHLSTGSTGAADLHKSRRRRNKKKANHQPVSSSLDVYSANDSVGSDPCFIEHASCSVGLVASSSDTAVHQTEDSVENDMLRAGLLYDANDVSSAIANAKARGALVNALQQAKLVLNQLKAFDDTKHSSELAALKDAIVEGGLRLSDLDVAIADDRGKCSVCLEQVASHAPPCGHRCLCKNCGDSLPKRICPICRNAFTCLIRIFDSTIE